MDRSPSLFGKDVNPYSDEFESALRSYCNQIDAAIRGNKHHDQRRNLFINFLREGLGLDPVEFELEKKIKVNAVRGRIDAFFQQLIIEVKTNLERERQDAESELKKYFESQPHPYDYIGLVTDGRDFEVFIYENRAARQIRSFTLDAESPLAAFRHLDQLFYTAKRLIPTSNEIVDRFGVYSVAYNAIRVSLLEAFDKVREETAVRVKFREWNALLSKVYGSEIGDETLFVTHTYLVMLSRVILTMALFPEARRNLKTYRGLVNGDFFRQKRLVNLAEPDFFAWALGTDAEQTFLEDIGRLFGGLDIYNFDKLDGDILKELYQGLVDPQSRHDLGEYYTPDWLAELTLEKMNYTGGRLLDPSCGSGSFLYAAARRLRKVAKLSKAKLVKAVIQDVIGIDVHPVAVLMAKANLLLSLKDEIGAYSEQINLQLYMADTLMTGEDREQNNLIVPVSENQETFHIPFETVDRAAGVLDALIDKLCEFAKRGAVSPEKERVAFEGLKSHLQNRGYSETEIFYWQQNFRLLLKLDREKRNSIWAFILKNAYRPSYLRRDKVDYIVGNPPWLSYRFINNAAYKLRVKALTFEYGLLEKTDRNLFTQMDTSTVFFAHCQHDFLKPNGAIAFVMPKTAMLPAKQHLRFQHIGFSQILDLSDVTPLFNVRSCVLIRGKLRKNVAIPCLKYKADFRGERNLTLAEAGMTLSCEQINHDFAPADMVYSKYHSKAFQGATLVPRCLWFVEPTDGTMISTETPFLRTSKEAHKSAKPPWTMEVEGLIEKDFLYGTVLAKNLIPFVVHHLTLVVLPVSVTPTGSLIMVNSEQALANGFVHAHDWFQNAETVWESHRKSESYTAVERLNYDNTITNQPFADPFLVLYNQSGTNLSATLLPRAETRSITVAPIQGFIVDSKCYWLATNSEEEAHYLVGILNSEIVNAAIKPLQTQGLQGERDIHRRPFEACNIPLYDAKDDRHRRIAALARECRAHLLPIVPKMDAPVARMRGEARELVADLLAKLDAEVGALLPPSTKKRKTKKKTNTGQETFFA